MPISFFNLRESLSNYFLTEGRGEPGYNDEHAHVAIWNHMVNKGISHNHPAMMKELQTAKKDTTHPLNFNNAKDEGFKGGKKTAAAKNSYYSELENAVHTTHALATHKGFAKAIKEKHAARVMGGAKGKVSDTWKKYGATQGATSKTDIAISNPKNEKHEGIKLSMKKGGGSQLMSAGPEETNAVHDHAAREMLNSHPKYSKLPQAEKTKIHNHIMSHIKKAGAAIDKMRTSSREEMVSLKNTAQKHLDAAHDAYPELNHYVRKEATTGEGKFGKGTPHAASYLVKSAAGKKEPKVTHVDANDYSGPRPRASLPKGTGRSGNVKLDER